MELLDDVDHMESCFGQFGDSASVGGRWCTVCAKCIIGLKIVSETLDGTPR
jgi:hypothetical protein